MKEIKLTRGFVAIVDDEDFDWLNQWKWHASTGEYAYATTNSRLKGVHKQVRMHRLIMGAVGPEVVDHISHNTMDNRRVNLRICTKAQNNYNKKPRETESSIFKGVVFDKRSKKFGAEICFNDKRTWLGTYNSELEAARAYDAIAVKLFGEYAKTNFNDIDQSAHHKKRVSRSSFRGVGWHAKTSRWRSYISPGGSQKHIGLFDSEIEAAMAYDVEAKKIYKDQAKLNFQGGNTNGINNSNNCSGA